MNVISVETPRTQLTFVNVPLVPVRTRSGERRYLCATWGGAMHLFDRNGAEKVIPYPPGMQGCYSFVPDVNDGYAWAVHTGGKITRIDVDAGAYDFVADVPLKAINWGAAITADGLLVCSASPAHIMVYDTRRRAVKFMFTPITADNNYGKHLLAAADGCVVAPMLTPGAELIRLDPRSGQYRSLRLASHTVYSFPLSFTFLPDGRLALPRAAHVEAMTYPDFAASAPVRYPEGGTGGWSTFRDSEDGRLFAWSGDGGPLYAMNGRCGWDRYLDRFSPHYRGSEIVMFSALPEGGLLGLTTFGELIEYDRTGGQRFIAQLDDFGHQRLCAVAPGDGAQVFTTTFINSSFQEMNYRTGQGRNIRPCQEHGGQASNAIWFKGKLWLACYGGAEINVYDPTVGGEWPQNPRPALLIGEEQMRPVGLAADGNDIWCATHAQYGHLGGALVRIDPEKLTRKVWRNLVPDSNPTGLAVHGGIIYVGTTIHRDCKGGPPGPGPAAIVAFDSRKEAVTWTSRPFEKAESLTVIGIAGDSLLIMGDGADRPPLALLDLDTGERREVLDLKLPPGWTAWGFFIGADAGLYVASEQGIFPFDIRRGIGERLVDGPVTPHPKPVSRGDDLFYVRGYEVVVVEGFWKGRTK